MGAPSYLFKFFLLANVCLGVGLLLNYALPALIAQLIDKQIALSQESQSYPMWREPPVPIYQKFFFYNVTNAQEIEQFGAKPHLVEIGPFTYRTEMSKRDIEFKASQPGASLEDLISFKNFKTWHFEPELSIADQSFELVTLNAPLAITLTLIQSASNAVRLLVTFSLDGLSEGFFTRRSIKQLLFDGYPDLLTTFGPLLNAEMLSQGGHFGYMNARNNTLDGTFEIHTGLGDMSKLNTITKYNGHTRLPYWHDSPAHCNSLEGATTGELFPSGKQPGEPIKLFQPDFCRVWTLEPAHEFESSNGLLLRRFFASRDIFKNSTELPKNSCFFSLGHHSRRANGHRPLAPPTAHHASNRVAAGVRRGRQAPPQPPSGGHQGNRHQANNRVRQEWPTGVFSLAPCKFNAPIYMSMPHFLDADEHYLRQVEGLAPDASKHEFFLDLEPRTGSPVAMRARVQLNVALSKPPGLVRFRNVPEIMFPVFWQELSVNLTGQPVMERLHLAARGALEANTRISYTFLILGSAILITTCLFHLHARLVHSRTSDLATASAATAAAAAGASGPQDKSSAASSTVSLAKNH